MNLCLNVWRERDCASVWIFQRKHFLAVVAVGDRRVNSYKEWGIGWGNLEARHVFRCTEMLGDSWVLTHQPAGAPEYTDCISAKVWDSPNECPGYDTKQSDGEASVILELWGIWSTLSLPSVLGPLWPRVVASDRVLSMDQIELNWVFMLNWIVWN